MIPSLILLIDWYNIQWYHWYQYIDNDINQSIDIISLLISIRNNDIISMISINNNQSDNAIILMIMIVNNDIDNDNDNDNNNDNDIDNN